MASNDRIRLIAPQDSGFTLLELMLVVSVIAIQTALAMSLFQEYYEKAHIAEVTVLGQHVTTAGLALKNDLDPNWEMPDKATITANDVPGVPPFPDHIGVYMNITVLLPWYNWASMQVCTTKVKADAGKRYVSYRYRTNYLTMVTDYHGLTTLWGPDCPEMGAVVGG